MGGGDDANIDADRRRTSDSLDLALLQHAEQSHLHARGDVRDLVEEEGAGRGLLEAAGSLPCGPGERARLVAEQLALEDTVGDRGAVETNERARAPGARFLDQAGNELLAGAGLTAHEHGGVASRHASREKDRFGQPAASSDEPVRLDTHLRRPDELLRRIGAAKQRLSSLREGRRTIHRGAQRAGRPGAEHDVVKGAVRERRAQARVAPVRHDQAHALGPQPGRLSEQAHRVGSTQRAEHDGERTPGQLDHGSVDGARDERRSHRRERIEDTSLFLRVLASDQHWGSVASDSRSAGSITLARIDASRSSSMVVDGRRSSSIGVDRRRSRMSFGQSSLRSHCGRSTATGPARRLQSGDVRPLWPDHRNNRVMNKNDKEIEIETETKTDGKPQVRIVDLEEVREVLGAAAAAQGMAAQAR